MTNFSYKLSLMTAFLCCLAIVGVPASAQAAELQYGSIGLIGDDSFGVNYSSPEGSSHFRCAIGSQECDKQSMAFSPRPSTEDITGTVYWSPQNTYAVAERPLRVFDKYLYRVYRNDGDTLSPVGYVPYYKKTTQLRFSKDESTLFLADADGTAAKIPTDAPFKATTKTINPSALGRWVLSPDGSLIAGFKQADDKKEAPYSLVVQSLKTGEKIASIPTSARNDIAISQDNNTIAFIDVADGERIISVRSLTDTDQPNREITKHGWVNHLVTAGGNFYFVANEKDKPYTYRLYRYNPNDDDRDLIERNIAETVALQSTPNRVFFGVTDGSARHIAQRDVTTGQTAAYELKSAGNREAQPAMRKRVVQIGDDLTGVLQTPHPREPQQFLVWLHGGPHRQASPGYNSSLVYGVYDELLNAFVRSGWGVLKLDYTGSVGYSQEFRNAIVNNIGTRDVANTNTAIDWINNQFDDPQINLMGVSYGGYLGLKTAVEQPDTVNKVVSVNGVTDWMTDTLIDPTFRPYFDGRPSPETIDAYMQSSLLYDLDKLKDTPIQIIQSTEDTIVDPVQAALLDRVAKKEEIPATYTQIDGAPHILQKRSHLNTLCTQTAKFLSNEGVCRRR